MSEDNFDKLSTVCSAMSNTWANGYVLFADDTEAARFRKDVHDAFFEINNLKTVAQDVVRYISNRSYQRYFGEEIVVEIDDNLNKLLNELDELSR